MPYMTEKVFNRDNYAFEFEATVLSVSNEGIELNITAFFPGGGGQVCDTGTIRGLSVIDVFYEDDKIIHKVPNNDLKVGETFFTRTIRSSIKYRITI
jgi:Predicted metal-dependent hydrolases related to alanyl-tRNA synthetase HxxxH domain